MAPLGLGIIGTGRIAQRHLQSLAQTDDGQAIAVYDVIPERAEQTAATFGIPNVARSLDELLERRDVSAVIVATPPAMHAQPTLRALEAGKHVLCEKPFALVPAEAEQMVAAATRSNRFLAVGSARRRVGIGPRTAHHLASSGQLGKVYHARSSTFRVRGRPGIDMFQDAPWFIDKARAGGGALLDIGVYEIDSLLWLLGNPKVTSVLCSTFQGIGAPPPDGVKQTVEDHAVVMFTTDQGSSGLVEIAWASNIAGATQTIVLGSEAGLRFDPLTRITAGPDRQAVEERLLELPDRDSSDFGDVTIQFARAIRDGRQPETPGWQALEVARVLDAAYRSAATGQAVSLS